MRSVELRPAFEWTCEECGHDQFERGLVPEMSEEEADELRWDKGVDVDEEGHWMMAPTHVECSECGAEFDVIHYGEDDEEIDHA